MNHVSRIACVLTLYTLGTLFLVLYRHEIGAGSRMLFFAVAIPYAVGTIVAFTADLAAARAEVAAWKATLMNR